MRLYRPCLGPGCQDRVQMGAKSCYFEATVLTEVLHVGKELPLAAPHLLQRDPRWAHPFRQKDGSYTGWAVSVRQTWVLIKSGPSNFFPCLFSAFVQVGLIWESWWIKMNEYRYNSQVIVNTYLPSKSIRKVFIGLNIETKFYFLKMTLHTSCKCTFRWENNE